MKKITCLLLAACCSFSSFAQTDPGWIRYAAISPNENTIVFNYKGYLYRVAVSGVNATALTVHEAHDFMPIWSHDGKQIGFLPAT